MAIDVNKVLKAIEVINQRKATNQIIARPAKGTSPNFPIGLDSLAYVLKIKIEELSPVIDEMIAFEVLEVFSDKKHYNGGSNKCKKVRLK